MLFRFTVTFLTGKSLSEALLFAENGENMLCTKIVLNVRNNFFTQHVLPRFELGIFMHWTCNSMNNLSSYCGLIDAKIRVSDKDLPVEKHLFLLVHWLISPTGPLNCWFAKAPEKPVPLLLVPPEGRWLPVWTDEGRWLPSWPLLLLEVHLLPVQTTCWFILLMPVEGRLFPDWPNDGRLFKVFL